MRTPPLLADFSHARACKPFCENSLTLPRTLADYLADAGFDSRRVAVERNGEIVPKRLYGETVLADGDTLEVVGFVGGG